MTFLVGIRNKTCLMVIKELCEQKLIKLNNILDLLAFTPPFVISQILRTNPIIIRVTELILILMMKMKNTRKPFWIQIITTMKKSIKQTNLERKNNRSQRETGDTRNIIEPQSFRKLRQVQRITYTSVLHIPPKPN